MRGRQRDVRPLRCRDNKVSPKCSHIPLVFCDFVKTPPSLNCLFVPCLVNQCQVQFSVNYANYFHRHNIHTIYYSPQLEVHVCSTQWIIRHIVTPRSPLLLLLFLLLDSRLVCMKSRRGVNVHKGGRQRESHRVGLRGANIPLQDPPLSGFVDLTHVHVGVVCW